MKYRKALIELLPPGVFDDGENSNIYKLFSALSTDLERTESSLMESFREVFPTLTADVSQWKSALGFASGEGLSDILFQMRRKGGAGKQVFLDILEHLGLSHSGDRVIPVLSKADCEGTCEQNLWDHDDWWYTFIVYLPEIVRLTNCEDPCDSDIITYQEPQTKDWFIRASPAHTTVFFYYY